MSANDASADLQKLRSSLVEPLAMAAVIFVLVVSGVVALRNFRELQENRLKVQHTSRVLAALREVEAAVMDAESRQRGFLITANESYIEPFNEAIRRANTSLSSITSITRNDPNQQQSLDELRTLIGERIDELKHVLSVRVSQGAEAAQLELTADAEKRTMERIHSKTNAMRQIENDVLAAREKAAAHSYRSGQTTSVLSTAIGLILVGGVLYLLERNRRKAEHAAMALRVTRERLQLALDAAELGSWNINPANQHLIGDQQFCKIFGFSEDECTYQRAIDALHPDDRSAVETAIAESTRMNDPAPYRIEYRVVHPDGTVLWVLAQGAANFTGKGNQRRLSSFDGTVVDITERKRQEQRLLESEQAALAASRSKSEFLANMSHEIRTPMAAILGYADVLLGHLKDPDNRNCVQVIKRNGQHLLELINDILDLSRIEAGKLEVEIESVSLPQLVADLQSLMQVRADAKKLDFRAVFTSKVP
ncbi:MAG: CHASE3 domain-containing protein, partial [Planctomycetales bacterium]|nr:CHASE3 domain-containing protein [Planctomycetales bacterium]